MGLPAGGLDLGFNNAHRSLLRRYIRTPPRSYPGCNTSSRYHISTATTGGEAFGNAFSFGPQVTPNRARMHFQHKPSDADMKPESMTMEDTSGNGILGMKLWTGSVGTMVKIKTAAGQ